MHKVHKVRVTRVSVTYENGSSPFKVLNLLQNKTNCFETLQNDIINIIINLSLVSFETKINVYK